MRKPTIVPPFRPDGPTGPRNSGGDVCCDICPYYDECEELDELQEDCCLECPDYYECQEEEEEESDESEPDPHEQEPRVHADKCG